MEKQNKKPLVLDETVESLALELVAAKEKERILRRIYGQQLKRWRKKNKYSLREAAKIMGCSHQQIKLLEKAIWQK